MDIAESMEIREHRELHRNIAILRDDGYCVLHFFKERKYVRAQDVHHVYGRSPDPGNPCEHYTRLMSLCRACHSEIDAILSPRSQYLWVADYLEKANKYPISPYFEHREEGRLEEI